MDGLSLVSGFALALDRRYHPETHMWVLATEPGRARVGMDALGAETSGTLAQLWLAPVGTELRAGRPFGQLEAVKFVGPLVSPVSGLVWAANDAAVLDAGLVEREPYGAGWLIEVELGPGEGEAEPLVAGADAITAWFTAKVAAYRQMGWLAQ